MPGALWCYESQVGEACDYGKAWVKHPVYEVRLFLDFPLFICSDADTEDGDQGPIWTFPPTIRPNSLSKLHKGMALHGSQKVCLLSVLSEVDWKLPVTRVLSKINFSVASRASAQDFPLPHHQGTAVCGFSEIWWGDCHEMLWIY